MRALTLAVLWTLGAGCEAEVISTTADLSLRHPEGCAVGIADSVTMRATGDFPPWERELDLAEAPGPLDPPADSRVLVFDGSYSADDEGRGGGQVGGVWTLEGGDQLGEVLMLPVGSGCRLSTDSPTIPPSAAVVALGDGALLAFGGHGPQGAESQVLMRRAGQLDLELIDAKLSVPRAWATATRVGSLVLIAGGGPGGDVRLIYDSFEVFDLETGSFVRELGGKLALGARRSHSAVALTDGRVLIVGGVGAGSEAPLSTGELVDPRNGQAEAIAGQLADGRSNPGMWLLRSGIVMVVGGQDARGITLPSAEWLDLDLGRFMPTFAPLSPHTEAVAARLPGNRIAWFGCDGRPGSCTLEVMLAKFDEVEEVQIDRMLANANLGQLRMQALSDGRLRIHAMDDTIGAPVLIEVDLNTGLVQSRLQETPVRELWPLGDGSTLQHGLDGMLVTRLSLSSPWDAVPEMLLSRAALGIALDGRSRWSPVSDEFGLSARAPQARFDLPGLLFGSVQVTLELDGNAELLLTPQGVVAIGVSIEQTRITVGDCNLSRTVGEPVHVKREGRRLTIESAGQSDSCSIDALVGPIGLAVRAAPGARIGEFRVTR